MHFCCMGCANVYAILLESGVVANGQNIRETEIFRRSLQLGLIANPSDESEQGAAEAAQGPTEEALLQISGMWCSACGWLIEHALRKLPGVVSAEVFFASDLAKVKYCPLALPAEAIAARITQLGYRAREFGGEDAAGRSDTHDLVLRLGIAAFLWANIMAFSVILYVGYFQQIAPSASRILPYILLALTTPLVFYCAYPILRSAAVGLRSAQLRMEVLLALGILTAYGLSAAQTLRGQTHLYFDTAAAIVTLMLAGKLIERSAKDRAARSVAKLYRLMPNKVRIVDDGAEHFTAIDALEPGTIFLVKPGERVPADGVVVEGETEADESLLTGESAPVVKTPGDRVASGSVIMGGAICVRALRTGSDSALQQIVRLVERALSTRAPLERIADRVSRIFVPSVVLIAVASLVILVAAGSGFSVALMRATSILVIACPCALGLATPLAITAALGRASQQGILISDSRILETLGKIDVAILDKTGTITQGDFQLLDLALISRDDAAASEDLALLAGLERTSEHLLGRAVTQYAHERRVKATNVGHVDIRKGEGVTGSYGGGQVFLGNRNLVHAMGCEIDVALEARVHAWQQQGRTVSYYGRDGCLRGLLAFGDNIKPGAQAMIQGLRQRGIAVKLLSGDSQRTTAAIAAWVGMDDYIAEATPQRKEELVRALQRAGHRVAVIGDGINDAPALAAADLGIAMGTGADIAMSAAPVVLGGGALEKVEEVFSLAQRTTRVVKQNLFWAFFYNVFGLALGVSGVLNPIFAAGAMLLSSACVVGNSMRLTRTPAARGSHPVSSNVAPQFAPAASAKGHIS
jgi:heavy metal translocating P-type ATPase